MNYNDYYNYINGYENMNYVNPNTMIGDFNYQSLMPNGNQGFTDQNSSIINSKEGFERGNIFANLYEGYKNYKPEKLVARSEREDMLLQIQELTFNMIELNLYLDVYPNDNKALKLFNDYLNKKEKLCKMFEEKYGPLTLDSDVQKNNWSWNKSPWPWEVQK